MKKLYFLLGAAFAFNANAQTYFSDDFEPAGGTLTQNNAWVTEIVIAHPDAYDWFLDDFGGDAYAKVSNYNSANLPPNSDMETWLITPNVDLSLATSPTLNFNNMQRFAGTSLEVKVSNDYDGSNFGTATWTDITSLATMDANTGSWNFVNSGDIDLTSYINSTFRLAFRYQGTTADGSTYQIDDVVINEGGAPPAPDLTIYDIQFTLDISGASDYDAQVVNTGGIVAAVVPSGPNQGYFLQSVAGSWNGIYVEDATNVPAVGDSVEITGTVVENFGNTQMESITAYTVVNSGNTLPAATAISTLEVNEEEYEGVLVSTTNATCIDPALGFGEWSINDGTDTCLVDDMMYAFSPAQGNVYDVTGFVFYSFGAAKLEPRDMNDVIGAGLGFTVYDIQFTTDPGGVSPQNGNSGTLTAIVVAESSGAFNSRDKGFWIADGSGAWHGMFVWDSLSVSLPAIGDSVTVTGTVNENFSHTIFDHPTWSVLNSGNTLPAAASVSTLDANSEEYEGVLVQVTNATCTNPAVGFGQWEVNDGSGAVLVDDVIYEFMTPVLNDVYDVTGVNYYTFGEYKILPRGAIDISTATNVSDVSIVEGIYPNPFNSQFNVNVTERADYTVMDINGRIVVSGMFNTGLNEVNMANLASGMYTLVVSNNAFKLVKE